jgi:hypothetical protein
MGTDFNYLYSESMRKIVDENCMEAKQGSNEFLKNIMILIKIQIGQGSCRTTGMLMILSSRMKYKKLFNIHS